MRGEGQKKFRMCGNDRMSKRTTPVIAFGILKTRFPPLSLYRFSLLCYFFAEKRFFFGAALLLLLHLGDWDSWMKTREQKNRDFIAPARTSCVHLSPIWDV
ncbi:hypothetical protein CDAR_10901 [Caerostris darwini]|uniref:Transmembrane protein n=1 Tax=Caerostris darwini TaxID=1538125 RepID=A0AAV4W6E7_9ARAC|nr:hypothetical protein CDAR_10901 [Caerostris darwini]